MPKFIQTNLIFKNGKNLTPNKNISFSSCQKYLHLKVDWISSRFTFWLQSALIAPRTAMRKSIFRYFSLFIFSIQGISVWYCSVFWLIAFAISFRYQMDSACYFYKFYSLYLLDAGINFVPNVKITLGFYCSYPRNEISWE